MSILAKNLNGWLRNNASDQDAAKIRLAAGQGYEHSWKVKHALIAKNRGLLPISMVTTARGLSGAGN